MDANGCGGAASAGDGGAGDDAAAAATAAGDAFDTMCAWFCLKLRRLSSWARMRCSSRLDVPRELGVAGAAGRGGPAGDATAVCADHCGAAAVPFGP